MDTYATNSQPFLFSNIYILRLYVFLIKVDLSTFPNFQCVEFSVSLKCMYFVFMYENIMMKLAEIVLRSGERG
jgi:hypothetical protein